ncbi:hypothetical protein OAV81_05175 [Candidatus Thioglobus sp.]|nr:hypothetical protein [Candidatus Thioglobus sp.]
MLKKIENLEDKHSGSMTAIIFGFLLFASGLAPYEETGTFNIGSMIGGISLVFGAIAYRMAKKRKLGVVKSSFIRITIEVICIIIAVLNVATTNRDFMLQHPIFVLIGASVTIAYLRIVTAK